MICMCTHDVITLLAADSAVSRLELVGGISANVSSILAGLYCCFPSQQAGQGLLLLAPPPSLHPPTGPVPGSSGSRHFLRPLSGTPPMGTDQNFRLIKFSRQKFPNYKIYQITKFSVAKFPGDKIPQCTVAFSPDISVTRQTLKNKENCRTVMSVKTL
jgi:hypothetical protein